MRGEDGRLSVFEELGLLGGGCQARGGRLSEHSTESVCRVRRGRPAWHRSPEGRTGPWLLLEEALLVKHTKL